MVDLGVPTKAEAKDVITQRLASIQNVVLDDDGAHLLPLEKMIQITCFVQVCLK